AAGAPAVAGGGSAAAGAAAGSPVRAAGGNLAGACAEAHAADADGAGSRSSADRGRGGCRLGPGDCRGAASRSLRFPMTARLIDGKQLARAFRERIAARVAELRSQGRPVRLDAVLVETGHAGARIYAENQGKTCEKVGI